MSRTINLILFLIILLFAVSIAEASSSQLEIENVEIKSDEEVLLRTRSSSAELSVDPGQELTIKIKLSNNYDEDTENDIEDVRVYSVIEGIDDGEDVFDESEDVKVRAGGYKIIILNLKIPEEASSYESYYLKITATGQDNDSREHSDDVVYDVEVKRDDHELIFERLIVSDAYCDDYSTVRIDVQNIGEQEEEEIVLEINVDEIETVFRDEFDLPSIVDEEESIYSKNKRVYLEEISPGMHIMSARLEYDDGREEIERTASFNVYGCNEQDHALKEDDTDVSSSVERYENPNRDLRFLFGDPDEKVVLHLPETTAPEVKLPVYITKKDDAFSVFILLFAELILFFFIILLILKVYKTIKNS